MEGDQAKRDQPFSVGTRAGVGGFTLWCRDDISSVGWIYGELVESFVQLRFSHNGLRPGHGLLLLVVAEQRL